MSKRTCMFVLAGLVLVVVAAAGLPRSAGSAAPAPRAVPVAGESVLLPGRYATSVFRPAFAFDAADGWRVEHDVRHDVFFFYGSPCCLQHADARTGFLFFLQPAQVNDPRSDEPVAAPADLLGWLRHNPHLKYGPTSPIAVGGEQGVQFAFSFASGTKHGDGCANVAPSHFGPLAFCPGDRGELAVVTVDGKQLLVVIQALPAEAQPRFQRKAHALLRTVSFHPGLARVKAPRTLVVGNADPTYDTEVFFSREVARLSHGSLQIAMRSDLFNGRPDNEQRVARSVERGTLDIGWDPTRTWDKLGVTTFRALQAPFLIDSLSLLRRVVTSPIAREVSSGTRRVGVLGLGLTTVNLRRPLGAKKPFVSLADFKGASINVIRSRLSEQAMEALGATPLEEGGGLHDALRTGKVDAAETAIDVVFENGYQDVAKYMTANVVFFPKPVTIDVNARMFARLTPAQRTALVRAAKATTLYSIEKLASQQSADTHAVCKAGIKFAHAKVADVAALAAAEKPVYDQLSADPLTGHVLRQIAALKRRMPPAAPLPIPRGCAA